MSQSCYIASGILEPAMNQVELYLKVIKPVSQNAEMCTQMKKPIPLQFGQKYSKYDQIGLEKHISRPQPVRNPLLDLTLYKSRTEI
jgi:hypothetical protein